MKFKTAGMVLLAGVAMSQAPVALADDQACTVILCLAGRLTNDSDTAKSKDCRDAETVFFSKRKFTHGHFDKSGTKKKRNSFIKGCTSDDLDGYGDKIINKFGGQRNGF